MTYESHITVSDISVEEFKSRCSLIGAKPVVIVGDTGSAPHQMMTSKFHRSDLDTAKSEMLSLSSHFGKVVRRKLELVVPWVFDVDFEPLYLEFHLKYSVPESTIPEFKSQVASLGCHSSENAAQSKTPEPGNRFVFCTARSKEVADLALTGLSKYNLVGKIREVVVFDDNPGLDHGWSPCFSCMLKA